MKVQANKKKEEKEVKDGFLNGILEQIRALLGGGEEQEEGDPQEFIIGQFKNGLNDNFTLLTNYLLPGTKVEIPMILVGPPGVTIIHPSAARGIFRAKEDVWYEMNDRKQTFEPAKINLVGRTLKMAGGIQKFLQKCGVDLDEVEAVMLFTDPGSHVDSANSAVRIVARDGIRNFMGRLLQAKQIFKSEDAMSIATLITRPEMAKQQIAKAQGQKTAPTPAIEKEDIPAAAGEDIAFDEDEVEETPSDDKPDWMKALDEPELEDEDLEAGGEGRFEDMLQNMSIEDISDRVNKLGFSVGQWALLAGFAGIICLTMMVAFFLLMF